MCWRRRELDLATAAEQDYAAADVLANAIELRKRRLQQLTRPYRLPEPRQVRLQTVEDVFACHKGEGIATVTSYSIPSGRYRRS